MIIVAFISFLFFAEKFRYKQVIFVVLSFAWHELNIECYKKPKQRFYLIVSAKSQIVWTNHVRISINVQSNARRKELIFIFGFGMYHLMLFICNTYSEWLVERVAHEMRNTKHNGKIKIDLMSNNTILITLVCVGCFAILSMESHTFTNVQIRWFFFHFHFHFDLWCNVTKFYWFPAFEANICSSWNWICTKVDMIWKTNFINGCMKNVLAIHFFLRNPFISFNTFP